MELLSLSEERLVILLQVMNNFYEINYFFKNNCQNKIGIFVMLRIESRVQESRVELKFRVQEVIDPKNPREALLTVNSWPRIQELQNEVIV